MSNSAIIGVQGVEGSFSEQAGLQFAKQHKLDGYEISYLLDSESVLSAIENEQCHYGIFAIENAQGGVVIESIEALAHHCCDIVTMFHVAITQNLMVLPGTKLTEVKSIHSHQQALRQCKNYLADHFWSCPLVEENDTADAAKRLSEGSLDKHSAVIANANCAELYHLEIIAPDIQDLKHNLTLFVAAQKMKELS